MIDDNPVENEALCKAPALDNPVGLGHSIMSTHGVLVLRALDGDTGALAELISEVYKAGQVDGIVLGTKVTTATLAKSS